MDDNFVVDKTQPDISKHWLSMPYILGLCLLSGASRACQWPITTRLGADCLQPLESDWQAKPYAKFHLEQANKEVYAGSGLLVTTDANVDIKMFNSTVPESELLASYTVAGKARKIWMLNYTTLKAAYDTQMHWQQPSHSKNTDILDVQPDLLPLKSAHKNQQPPFVTTNGEPGDFDAAKWLQLDKFWRQGKGQGLNIAIIDFGFNLQDAVFKRTRIVDAWDLDSEQPVEESAGPNPHGSRAAAIIWGQPDGMKNNPAVIAGIAPDSGMIALQVTRPWTSNLLKAFYRAEINKADAVNVSWLLAIVTKPLYDYLHYFMTEARHGTGIAIIASAKPSISENEGLATLPEVIVVTPTDYNQQLANASWDENSDVGSLGYVITSAFHPGRQFALFKKSSAAAPVITAITGLIRQSKRQITVIQLNQLLRSSCVKKQIPIAAGAKEYCVLDYGLLYRRVNEQPAKIVGR